MAHYTLKWFNKLAENLLDYEIFTRVKECFILITSVSNIDIFYINSIVVSRTTYSLQDVNNSSLEKDF